MACPGGCIDGGGQPYLQGDIGILEKRMKAIQNVDRNKKVRLAHENESIKQIYDEYLGKPGGDKAHKLLHTHLVFREKM